MQAKINCPVPSRDPQRARHRRLPEAFQRPTPRNSAALGRRHPLRPFLSPGRQHPRGPPGNRQAHPPRRPVRSRIPSGVIRLFVPQSRQAGQWGHKSSRWRENLGNTIEPVPRYLREPTLHFMGLHLYNQQGVRRFNVRYQFVS